MKNKSTTTTMVASKIKDNIPELDDVKKIAISNHDAPTPYEVGLIEGMAAHFLTSEDICAIISMPRGRFDKHLEYQAAYQRGQGLGRASLHRMQMVSAKTNPVMLIWLGKQHLGQADKVEATQGESQLDAYTGFLNKFNLVINVSTEGKPTPIVIGTGKGDSELCVENVGKDSPASAIEGRVVSPTEDAQVDRRVEPQGAELRKSFHGLVEDMVVSGGTGKRKDESGSGVGPNTD